MNTAMLVEELKKHLKKRGITYAALGKAVGLSEPAVKRAFAARNFSLRRLDAFCAAAGVDLAELALASARAEESKSQLSPAVEEELAADPELLITLYLILLRQPLAAIRRELTTDKAGVFRLARRLEALELVEVHPGDRFRAKIAKSVRWRADGPLVRRYGPAIQSTFFASAFDGPQEHQDFLTGALTPESFGVMKRKFADLFRFFDELSEIDAKAAEARTEGFWFYAGIRPWDPIAVIRRAGSGSGIA